MTEVQANEVMVDTDIIQCTFIDEEVGTNPGIAGNIDLEEEDDYDKQRLSPIRTKWMWNISHLSS